MSEIKKSLLAPLLAAAMAMSAGPMAREAAAVDDAIEVSLASGGGTVAIGFDAPEPASPWTPAADDLAEGWLGKVIGALKQGAKILSVVTGGDGGGGGSGDTNTTNNNQSESTSAGCGNLGNNNTGDGIQINITHGCRQQ